MFRFENLEIWKRSIEITDRAFETVNMLIIAERRKFIASDKMKEMKNELEEVSKMVTGLSNSLSSKTLRSPL